MYVFCLMKLMGDFITKTYASILTMGKIIVGDSVVSILKFFIDNYFITGAYTIYTCDYYF